MGNLVLLGTRLNLENFLLIILAITPKKELCFSVFAIQKPSEVFISNTLLDLDLTKKFNSLFKENYK